MSLSLNSTGLINNGLDYNIDVDELTEDDPKAEQPENIKIVLKSHQLTLLNKCIQYENEKIKLKDFPRLAEHVNETDYFYTKMGVIADRVGSGKSYVILSLILSNDIVNRDNTMVKSCGMNNVIFYFKDAKTIIKTNLLVIPHNLCSQWEKYIKTYSDRINYKLINKAKIIDNLIESETDISEYDLIVVTGTFFNRFTRLVKEKNVKLQRIFFDEIDNLNIPGCGDLEANFFWFVTASYGNTIYPRGHTKYDTSVNKYIWYATGLRNSGFVKTLFTDLYVNLPRDFMKVLMVKNSEAYVESSLSLPEVITNIIKCKTPHSINILHGIVDKNIIDCLNAGDVTQALSYINVNNKNTEDNIITLLIDKYNKQVSNIQLRITMTSEYIYDTERDRENELLSLNKRMEDIKTKIRMISERIHNSDICSICYDDIENKAVTRCCQNSFCFKCIHIWLSKKAVCPLCKEKLLSTDIFTVLNNEASTSTSIEMEDEPDPDTLSSKFDKIKNFEILIKKIKNGKILIFSNYDTAFQNIVPVLNNNGISYNYIKGNGNQIKCVVEKYKTSDLNVLLVNTRNYGSGLNLENTTDIIMFHKFDVSSELQLIGRAQRYGRVNSLKIHYLLFENECRHTSAPILI
jgi:hypothetical protein